MNIFEIESYKQVIKETVLEKKKSGNAMTLKRLSEKIDMQYTYLSKVLNQEDVHLSEDHLFKTCYVLGFGAEDTDYLLTLRQRDVAQDQDRQNFLTNKIDSLRASKKLNAEILQVDNLSQPQIEYLFNPLAVVVHIAINVPQFKEDPLQLCSLLGIDRAFLKSTLKLLEANDYVILSNNYDFKIEKVLKKQFHIGKDNPLMRMHQNLLRLKMAGKSFETSENDKNSFFVTFSGNQETMDEVNSEFNSFIKKVEEIVGKAKKENVFQMSFDLLRWL